MEGTDGYAVQRIAGQMNSIYVEDSHYILIYKGIISFYVYRTENYMINSNELLLKSNFLTSGGNWIRISTLCGNYVHTQPLYSVIQFCT